MVQGSRSLIAGLLSLCGLFVYGSTGLVHAQQTVELRQQVPSRQILLLRDSNSVIPFIELDLIAPLLSDPKMCARSTPTSARCFDLKYRYKNALSGRVLSIQIGTKRYKLVNQSDKKKEGHLWIGVTPSVDHFSLLFFEPNSKAIRETIAFGDSKKIDKKLALKPSKMTLSLSYGIVQFTQSGETSSANTTLNPLTLKLDYLKNFLDPKWKNWSLSANAFGTLTSLKTSRTDLISVRYVGANGRLGYQKLAFKDRLSMGLALGAYYQTMIVSDQLFGYQNAAGPQAFAKLGYSFSSVISTSASARIAILPLKFFSPTLQSNETAYGVRLNLNLKENQTLGFEFDYSSLHYEIESTVLENKSTSIGINYGLSW